MDLLRKYKVDEHFPAPGMEHLVTIGGDTPISDALKLMIGRNILSVPVLSSTDQGRKIGLIDMTDIVKYILDVVQKEELTDDNLDAFLEHKGDIFHSASAEKVGNLSKNNPCVPVSSGSNLADVAHILAEHGVHRIPVVNRNGDVVNLITQSTVVDLLAKHVDSLGSIVSDTLHELQMGYKPVISILKDNKVIEAFALMVKFRISAVCIVDNTHSFVGNISVKDIQALTREKSLMKYLFMDAHEFVKHIRHEIPTDSLTIQPSSTIATALARLHANKVHRLYVVNADKQIVGVVSLRDVLGLFAARDQTKKKSHN
jgi:CBS domain-containing protein